MADSAPVPYFDRPLAPAPLPMLAGVVALVALLLIPASSAFESDWVTVFAGMAVLVLGGVLLDMAGRREAAARPNAIYVSDRLPAEKTRLKPFLVILTLVALVAVVTAQARPDEEASPLPYFLAAEFIFLLLPQLLAQRIVRRPSGGRTAPAK